MSRLSRWIVAVALMSVPIVPPVPAQTGRNVVERIAPVYPELARRANLAGVVKIEATVRPNGTVKDARVIGGNPVLSTSATDAVRKWKFEPAAGETIELVEIRFGSH